MKSIKFILLPFVILVATIANAQWRPTGNLTVFSENGDAFYLVLNGIQYNDNPQTHIRIEELPNPYYSCKIIFANKNLPSISKSVLQVADASGVMQDVTYWIKKDRRGNNVLRFYSYVPAQQNMPRPADCATYRFGNPDILIAGPGFSARVDINTRNRRDRYDNNSNDYYYNPDQHDYYETDQYSNHNYDNYNNNRYDNHRRNDYGRCRNTMNSQDFSDATSTISNTSFDESKLTTAKQIISSNCMTTSQIVSIMNLFGFESTKLDFAKYAYSYCVDRNNYFRVNNAFSFSSSKTELSNYIQSMRR